MATLRSYFLEEQPGLSSIVEGESFGCLRSDAGQIFLTTLSMFVFEHLALLVDERNDFRFLASYLRTASDSLWRELAEGLAQRMRNHRALLEIIVVSLVNQIMGPYVREDQHIRARIRLPSLATVLKSVVRLVVGMLIGEKSLPGARDQVQVTAAALRTALNRLYIRSDRRYVPEIKIEMHESILPAGNLSRARSVSPESWNETPVHSAAATESDARGGHPQSPARFVRYPAVSDDPSAGYMMSFPMPLYPGERRRSPARPADNPLPPLDEGPASRPVLVQSSAPSSQTLEQSRNSSTVPHVAPISSHTADDESDSEVQSMLLEEQQIGPEHSVSRGATPPGTPPTHGNDALSEYVLREKESATAEPNDPLGRYIDLLPNELLHSGTESSPVLPMEEPEVGNAVHNTARPSSIDGGDNLQITFDLLNMDEVGDFSLVRAPSDE